jgi:mono/diheme cytochrome c family protein
MKRKIATSLLLVTLLLSGAVLAEQTEDPTLALIQSLGCKGCHSIAKEGATTAPPLGNRAAPLSEAAIVTRLMQGRQSDNAFMPTYHWLNGAQRQAIAQYLIQLEK